MDGTKKRNARLIMNSGLKLNFIQFFFDGAWDDFCCWCCVIPGIYILRNKFHRIRQNLHINSPTASEREKLKNLFPAFIKIPSRNLFWFPTSTHPWCGFVQTDFETAFPGERHLRARKTSALSSISFNHRRKRLSFNIYNAWRARQEGGTLANKKARLQ